MMAREEGRIQITQTKSEYKAVEHCDGCIQIPEMRPVKLIYECDEGSSIRWCPMCKAVYGCGYLPYILVFK